MGFRTGNAVVTGATAWSRRRASVLARDRVATERAVVRERTVERLLDVVERPLRPHCQPGSGPHDSLQVVRRDRLAVPVEPDASVRGVEPDAGLPGSVPDRRTGRPRRSREPVAQPPSRSCARSGRRSARVPHSLGTSPRTPVRSGSTPAAPVSTDPRHLARSWRRRRRRTDPPGSRSPRGSTRGSLDDLVGQVAL